MIARRGLAVALRGELRGGAARLGAFRVSHGSLGVVRADGDAMMQSRSSAVQSRGLAGFLNSVNEGLRNKVEQKKDESAKEQETKMLAWLATVEKLDYIWFKGFLEETLKTAKKGVLNSVPYLGNYLEENNKDMEYTKTMINMISVMKPDEAAGKVDLTETAKKRIAAAGMVGVEEVNKMVNTVEQLSMLQKWLRRRALEGRETPKTHEEVRQLMFIDRRGVPARPPWWQIKQYKKKMGYK